MLETYYDLAQKPKFEARFGNLWIGSHPTPLQGTYQILSLDFSRASDGISPLAQSFDEYCSMKMNVFARKYESCYYPGFALEMKEQGTFTAKLNFLNSLAQEYGAVCISLLTSTTTSLTWC